MSQNYQANPTDAPLITRPGESKERLGTTNVTGLLPDIFRTHINKKFLNSTLEQLLSSGSLQAINSLVGSNNGYRKASDIYDSSNRFADNYQFTPSLVNKNDNNEITDVLSYDDFISALEFNGVDVNNHNNILNENGYTLRLPINYDMFINYHKYFWALNTVPVCELDYGSGPLAEALLIDDIDGLLLGSTYTTPTLANGKTLTLENGMRVKFIGDNVSGVNYAKDITYIVDNVGQPSGIKLTEQYDATGTKTWINKTIYNYSDPIRDYVVEPRFAAEQSAWSRTNLWVKDSVVISACDYNDLDSSDYAIETARAVRPIIEFFADCEKFDFGTEHLMNVSHAFENIVAPGTDIIGATNFNLASHLATTIWSLTGFDKGDKVYVDSDGELTYWECAQTHNDAKNPTFYMNSEYWKQIVAKTVVDGDTILFISSTDVAYNNTIRTAVVDGTGLITALTPLHDSGTLTPGDKIVVTVGYNEVFGDEYPNDIWSGSEWYWDNTTWVYGQQKDYRSEGMLFQAYDIDLNKLDDAAVYPNSSFAGDPIFDYSKSTSSIYDFALGFKPKYAEYGNNPGFEFTLGSGSIRYAYNKVNTNVNLSNSSVSNEFEIAGFYYFKNINTGKFTNNWTEVRGGQPVRRHYQNIFGTPSDSMIVDLGTNDVHNYDSFRVLSKGSELEFHTHSNQNSVTTFNRVNGTNPVLFMARNKTYTFKTVFDSDDLQFKDVSGNNIPGLTRSPAIDNEFTISLDGTVTDALIKYTLPGVDTGWISLSDIKEYNVDVTIRNDSGDTVLPETAYVISDNHLTITHDFAADDVVDVTWHTDGKLTSSAQGSFLPADTHILNPQNELVTTVEYSDLQHHIKSQMTSIPGFSGSFFGTNNYTALPMLNQSGGTIRQQAFSTELLTQTLSNTDSNPFSSLRFVSQRYNRFKSQFTQKVKQLHNTTDTSIPVYELVDRALREMNLGKNRNSDFSQSDMAFYNGYESVDVNWYDGDSNVFSLPQTINTFDDTVNHVQLWLKDVDGNGVARWRALIKDIDYTLTNYNVTINTSVTFDGDSRAYAHIRWYPQNSSSFIPPSAAKMGLVRPTKLSQLSNFYIDAGYITGQDDFVAPTVGTYTDALQLHDGSIHVRMGTELYNRNSSEFNIVDAAIWELDTRIENNLSDALNTVVDYKTIMPTAHRSTSYSWDDMSNAMRDDFNRWKTRNSVTVLNSASYYDAGDKFTWNYSSVGPGIGGWKGVYTYYFNTDRPHTHPWEMFGYNTQPTWWIVYYDWTDVNKKAALITALKTGHYNNPADTPKYSIDYAYTNYDWDTNTLVDITNVLLDPVAAAVVTAPVSVEASKDFVFGDLGPIESSWRNSSEYKINLFSTLMKLQPLWTINTYFRSLTRSIISNPDIDTVQHYFKDTKNLGNNKNANFTYLPFADNILSTITVTNGGTYATAPVLTVFSNFGDDATVTAHVNNGTMAAVSIDNPGGNFTGRPTIVTSEGNATFNVTTIAGATRYFGGMGNAIVEFAKYNNTPVDTLVERFNNMGYSPIVKASGFVNNDQNFILESSHDKGRVYYPADSHTTILYTSQPKDEKFFSSVKITKLAQGFSVSGMDNVGQTFSYYAPITTSSKIAVDINNKLYYNYSKYDTTATQLAYSSVLDDTQAVYNFILGYEKYLLAQGWKTAAWAAEAQKFVEWNATAAAGDYVFAKPDTSRLEITEPTLGYYDSLSTKYDGAYNLVDADGKLISNDKVLISRNIETSTGINTVMERKDNDTIIHGIRFYTVELEHVIVFDNESLFNDVVYQPAMGNLRDRITWRGTRTKDWNGKLYAPGFVVTGDRIVNNFDTVARELDQYYGPGNTLSNQQMLDVARFNVGYNRPAWADSLTLDDDTVWNFVKGTYKYSGTENALNALLRTTALYDTVADVTLHEDWAIRTADYGDTRSNETLEFVLTRDLVKTNPQPIRFTDGIRNDVLTDFVVDVDSNSNLLVTGTAGNNFQTRAPKQYNNTTSTTFADLTLVENDFSDAGLPLLTEADYRVLNRDDFVQFPTEVKDAYDFSGEWQSIGQWDNKTSYKFGDKVIYQGSVFQMVDSSGATGITRPNNPIDVVGTAVLPIISKAGGTFIIGESSGTATTINIVNTTTTTNYNPIAISGTEVNPVLAQNTTLVIASDDNELVTVTFANISDVIVYDSPTSTGDDVVNPVVSTPGGTLIVDGTTITFNDIDNNNINAESALLDVINGSLTVARINAIEALRLVYPSGTWGAFLASYFATSVAGLDITFLLTERGTPAYEAEIDALITNDVNIINSLQGTVYSPTLVIAGTETVAPQDSTAAQTDMEAGTYIDDVSIWLAANLTTVFSSSTVVASQSTNRVYNLAAIIQKITAAAIPNIVASNSSNQLKITKTNVDTSTAATLIIGEGTLNTTLGFPIVGETVVSTGIAVPTAGIIDLTSIVSQINTAVIPGISAQASLNNTLTISSNSTQVVIDASSTALTALGIVSGTILATSNVSSTSSTNDIDDIVSLINAEGLSGILAANSNNRLKITSTASTLYIGPGTINSVVGLQSNTYTASQTVVSNTFQAIRSENGDEIQVFLELENDPAVFSIWVADDSSLDGLGNFGYDVHQSMDFGMYVSRACAGITEADNAEITVSLASDVTNNKGNSLHNLTVGDYVLITGSNTTPKIDGIHKVVEIDANNKRRFFIDEFIEKEGNVGNIYPLRSVRFDTIDSLLSEYNSFTTVDGLSIPKYNFAGFRQNNSLRPIYAFVNSDDLGRPAVYRWTGRFGMTDGNTYGDWVKVRVTYDQARNDLIENVKIFDAENQTYINNIEIFDPFKGIIPGFAEREIDYKSTNDIAIYNFNNASGSIVTDNAWKDSHVDERWWDLRSAVYLNYEQGNIDYKRSHWGRLFDGASIDIYEWTRSPSLPEEWETLVTNGAVVDGKTASGEAYSYELNNETIYQWTESVYYNPDKNRTETTYYFWVKNKTTTANNRNYNVSQLRELLTNPSSFDISWAAAAGADELILSNVYNFTSDNSVVQVNQKYESETLTNSEYVLLSEKENKKLIPEYLHIKMRDSLVGYNRYSERYTYTSYDAVTTYSVSDVVLSGNDYYISLRDVNTGNTPNATEEFWRRIYDYELPAETQATDIDVLSPILLPNIRLHPYNRFGHLTRPAQSLIRNKSEARQNFIEAFNSITADIVMVSEYPNLEDYIGQTFVEGEVTYNPRDFWNYVDYTKRTYNTSGDMDYMFNTDTVVNYRVDSLTDIREENISGTYQNGDLVYVSSIIHSDGLTRPAIYRRLDNDWVLEWKKNGTIEFSEELWNVNKYGHGFDVTGFDSVGFDSDPSNILYHLIEQVRNKMFLTKPELYNKLWFSWLHQAVTENTTSDFAFKTTYTSMDISYPLNTTAKLYQPQNTDVLEGFFNDIKPFHTKLRKINENPTHDETSKLEISETYSIGIVTP